MSYIHMSCGACGVMLMTAPLPQEGAECTPSKCSWPPDLRLKVTSPWRISCIPPRWLYRRPTVGEQLWGGSRYPASTSNLTAVLALADSAAPPRREGLSSSLLGQLETLPRAGTREAAIALEQVAFGVVGPGQVLLQHRLQAIHDTKRI